MVKYETAKPCTRGALSAVAQKGTMRHWKVSVK